jgi:hypothetical protein
MTLLGKNIKLTGKSQKGKNRVREHGNDWNVLAETDVVLFSPGKKGPWLFITPVGQGHDSKAARWIHAISDQNFLVAAGIATG